SSSSSLGVGSVAGVVRHADRSERASAAWFPHGPPPRLHLVVFPDWKPLLRHPHLWLPQQRERVRRWIRAWSRRLLRRYRCTGRRTIAGEGVGVKLALKAERMSLGMLFGERSAEPTTPPRGSRRSRTRKQEQDEGSFH